jgi:uncharacterized protein YacL
MLSQKEEAFIAYWSENRTGQKKSFPQYLKGFSIGLTIGIGIILVISIGWYQRANMEANSSLNPFILILIILIISVFMAFLYKNYQWEMKEQQYLELLAKKKKLEKAILKQQEDKENSQ